MFNLIIILNQIIKKKKSTNINDILEQKNSDDENENDKVEDFKQILTKWKLQKYISNFEENGFDEVSEWKDLTDEDVSSVITNNGRPISGHIRRFKKNLMQMFPNSCKIKGVN